MRRGFAGITLLAVTLIAAAPAPKPVITIDGVTHAAGIDATVRGTITRSVAGLNAGLEKIVALHRSYLTASPAERERIGREMEEIHQKCKALHDAVIKELTPDQQAAYFDYLHAQLKAAGIDMTQFQHGGMMPDSGGHADEMHGAMANGHGD